jgi:probable O-glycosylation ligase (exosortase A-associated)
MRDLIVFFVVFALLPVCVARPFVGVLLYAWLGYMNPHRLTWGAAFDFPFAQLVAIATFVGLLVALLVDRKRLRFPLERETVLLLALWFMFFVTTFFALRPDWAWPRLEDISKIMLMTFLTIAFITDWARLRLLVLVILVSLAFYGVKGGIFAIASGGNFMVFGPPKSFIGDNTALGIALNMVLPMLFFQARIETNRHARLALRGAFALTVLAVLFTYSRGAFLGLAAVLGLLFFRLSIKLKALVIVAALVATPIVLVSLPDKFVDRVETLKTYEQDGSANARLVAWATAWEVAKDRPLTGGGFQVIDDVQIGRSYNPDFTPKTVGVHSSYFEVMAENGLVAFALFAGLLISALLTLSAIRRRLRDTPNHPGVHYSHMFQTSIFGYAVSGLFLEFASFDLYYHVIALVIVLKSLVRQELEPAADAAKVPSAAAWVAGARPAVAGGYRSGAGVRPKPRTT